MHMIVEISEEEAVKLIKKQKGSKIMFSIVNLEANDCQNFNPIQKDKCFDLIATAETLSKNCDNFVSTINAYSVKQNIKKIKRKGKLITFLIFP